MHVVSLLDSLVDELRLITGECLVAQQLTGTIHCHFHLRHRHENSIIELACSLLNSTSALFRLLV